MFNINFFMFVNMTKATIFIFLFCLAVTSADIFEQQLKSFQQDAQLNFTQLATKYGYPVELHSVPTKDGYILTVHRIPYGKNCGSGKGKIPVLIQHGLFSSSIDFILSGPEKSLGYLLAEECYDVWLSNSRGNRYSRNHLSSSVKDKKFWEFSWHEMGVYDLPAVIDYILENTKQKNLHYIGHSQGTTQFFVFASLCPNYREKLRSAHALAPVSYLRHMKHPIIRILAFLHKPLSQILNVAGVNDLLPFSDNVKLIGREICCSDIPEYRKICENILYLITGSFVNMTVLPAVLGHTPAGASTRQLVHYAQIFLQDEFRQFDYGIIENIAKYGSAEPPIYQVREINVPTALYYSENDWWTDVIDVNRIGKLLPNVIGKFRVPRKQFGHVDFIYGSDVPALVYKNLFSIMKKY